MEVNFWVFNLVVIHEYTLVIWVFNYHNFSLTQLCVDDDSEKVWTLYDTGPKSVRCPLMCMPPASGKADIFFKQMLALSASGYRVIGVSSLILPIILNSNPWSGLGPVLCVLLVYIGCISYLVCIQVSIKCIPMVADLETRHIITTCMYVCLDE